MGEDLHQTQQRDRVTAFSHSGVYSIVHWGGYRALQSISLDPTSKVFLLELGDLSQVFCVHCKKSKAEKT